MPQVDPQDLARQVARVEFGKMFATFDELCAAVAATKWAGTLGLTAQAIGRLILSNNVSTKVEKPTTPPKRGRGRPRKSEQVNSDAAPPKRGRGRPPKSEQSEQPKSEQPKSEKKTPKVSRNDDGHAVRYISTPAGPPPAKLQSLEPEAIEEWVEHVQSIGRSQGVAYRPEALVYWLRHFVDIHSAEYRSAKQVVSNAFFVKTDNESDEE